jgi:pyruvate/2-oxoacid:ferredoxin oxidoreductase alpha subunit
MAWRVGEDKRVSLPIAIGLDGAFLTHSQHIVKIPTQAAVDSFLPKFDLGDRLLHPDNPITIAPQVDQDWLMEIRRQNDNAMRQALTGDQRGARGLQEDLRPRRRQPVPRRVHDRGRRRSWSWDRERSLYR